MIKAWLRKELHLKGEIPAEAGTLDLLLFAWHKGILPWLNGLRYCWRFKAAGHPVFIAPRTRILFPGHIRMGNHVMIGAGSVINGFSQEGMVFEDGVHIQEQAWIQATSRLDEPGKGLVIGARTYVGPHAYFGAGGGIRIGKDVVIGASVHLRAENHAFDDPAKPVREQGVTRKGIVIGDDVWIGNQAIVLDGVTIGTGSVIGAGAVVTHDVPPGSVAAGSPARVIRKRGDR